MEKISTVGKLIKHLEKLPTNALIDLWTETGELPLGQIYFNVDSNHAHLSNLFVVETSPIPVKIDNIHTRMDGNTFEFSLEGKVNGSNI